MGVAVDVMVDVLLAEVVVEMLVVDEAETEVDEDPPGVYHELKLPLMVAAASASATAW